MNPAGQAHPVSLRASHIQRAIDRMRNDINLAWTCVRWLIDQGYVPTHVDAGETIKPIVWIETKPICEKLKAQHSAYYYRTDGMPGGRIETWRAEVMGCHVQWFEVKTRGAH